MKFISHHGYERNARIVRKLAYESWHEGDGVQERDQYHKDQHGKDKEAADSDSSINLWLSWSLWYHKQAFRSSRAGRRANDRNV